MLPVPGTSSEFRNFCDFPEFSPEHLKFPIVPSLSRFPELPRNKSEMNPGTFDGHGVGEIGSKQFQNPESTEMEWEFRGTQRANC